MNNTSDLQNSSTKRSNMTLWILLGSFLIPAILAYGYFFFGNRPSISSNGTLINPIIDIQTLKLTNQAGEMINREELTPKWRMYYFVNEACDTDCLNDLYNMRQINIALGKNQDRVQHVIVHLNKPKDDFIELIEKEHKEAVRLFTTAENKAVLVSQNDTDTYIYLVDPLGNIMMKFSSSIEAKLILKDINKLLKISRIG